ncbi:SAM-dependent methyltransferase [Alteriqipengyuania lutimaris]|uniref:Class I SAM-dependent methyltransferase n=1 Tax=Alteriqipengyuania lutimaris TaxID=1538146 RepID=A0A395LHH7_9SPHN|nr:methyltransferase domain-containing protein [Alteriqipengyuania lutimaris]MBB3035533.1 SAM-dependent methyltransferase [Alteriqipengyuania lutimaris]RDS76089.1 class I SAM-dependent methyltransferase [Alteriqipengyuania lutimaris]
MPIQRHLAALWLALLLAACGPHLDIHYVATPQPVVDAMLDMAEVGPGDVVYDLGSGDGRIPITAAKRFGVRAVGIELDPRLLREARRNAEEAGVSHLVEFRQEDLFEADISDASVVTLYLGDMLNLRLRPRLLDLPTGTRVVSQSFNMGDWLPDERRVVSNRPVYRWTVPELFVPGFPSLPPEGDEAAS